MMSDHEELLPLHDNTVDVSASEVLSSHRLTVNGPVLGRAASV
jgi:hypothetical protein